MQGLTLTRHFVERWQERVGNWPTPEAVQNYVRQSVKVQWCEDFVRKDGSPFRMLAIYWHPELDLVMKVDTEEWMAVTVLSRDRYVKRQMPPSFAKATEGREVSKGRGFVPALAARIARVRERFGIGRKLAANE